MESEPLLAGGSADLQPDTVSGASRGLSADVPLGSGAITFELGPHETSSRLVIEVDDAEFRRTANDRGVYVWDDALGELVTVDSGAGPYTDGSQAIQVTVDVQEEEDAADGTNLAVRFTLADAQGEMPHTLETARLRAIPPIWLSIYGSEQADGVPLLLHAIRCP